MTEKEKVEEIMEKYNRNFSTLQKNASANPLFRSLRTVDAKECFCERAEDSL